jgi:hypothetical protein
MAMAEAQEGSQGEPTAPDPEERDALERLVKGIVVAQGNLFVKELLREQGIRIGTTKADFERNLLEAIGDGRLSRTVVDEWLDRVEGWGDQHIYLYNVPAAFARDLAWRDGDEVRRRIESAGYGDYWNVSTSLEFPDEMTLTGISFAGRTLTLTWHRGAESWVRDKDRDYRETLDGDLYEFRAYRYRAKRAVTRFVLRIGDDDPRSWAAALLIPIAFNSPEHEELKQQVERTLKRLATVADFAALQAEPVPIANVIKKIDQAGLGTGRGKPPVTAQSTRLLSGGAFVEFGSTSLHDDYRRSTAVRNVRQSIGAPQLGQFTGSSGSLELKQRPSNGLSRDVKVQLYGEDRRVRIWKQLTAAEVWTILDTLRRYQ